MLSRHALNAPHPTRIFSILPLPTIPWVPRYGYHRPWSISHEPGQPTFFTYPSPTESPDLQSDRFKLQWVDEQELTFPWLLPDGTA
jgi:hypothetical protein